MREKSEEELQEAQEKKDEAAIRRLNADLRKVLSLAEGRRVLYHVIYAPHLGALEQVLDSSSSEAVIFHNGKRKAAQLLLGECLEANPKRTKVMLKESLDE